MLYPVSYTHLDVYKRQEVRKTLINSTFIQFYPRSPPSPSLTHTTVELPNNETQFRLKFSNNIYIRDQEANFHNLLRVFGALQLHNTLS